MPEVETEYLPWAEVSRTLVPPNEDTRAVLAAMEVFGREKVLRVRAPFGTALIERGRFQWDLLENVEELREAYGDAFIPLGMVTAKVLELNAPVPGQSHRYLPIYIVPEGRFFGLFETYAPGGVQSKLWGTAGASTLLVLPLIGNGTNLGKFARSRGWIYASDIHQGIKRNRNSPLAFGRFFEALLGQVGSEWRMEFVIFPRPLVDALEKNGPAYGALRQLALEQIATAHSRAETTIEMMETHTSASEADALAVRQVAYGLRPSFYPVFGTPDDERLLPAAELHEMVYDENNGLFSDWCENEKSDCEPRFDYYPAIFRPSLPWEDSFYFLKRSYGPEDETPPKIRFANLRSAIEKLDRGNREKGIKRMESKLFTTLTREELQAMLERQLAGIDLEDKRRVRLGSSPFADGGVIHVRRLQSKKP